MSSDTIGRRNSNLFVSEASRESIDGYLLNRLKTARSNVLAGNVSPTINMAEFRAELASKDFQQPEALESVLEWTISSMENGLVHTTHPRYFGLFNPSPTFPAICADYIAAEFNPQVCVWSHAPVAVEIENHVIQRLAERVGFSSSAGGHFTSGGAEANNTAVVCALTSSNDEFANKGARAFAGQPRIYVSKESHLAWYKIAHQLGIGRASVRLIDTDGNGRMDSSKLEQTVRQDIELGDVPVLIAATAGTTNAGVVDSLNEAADIATNFDLWFHVDAAWGGALLASREYMHVLKGIERADSVTIDAHKWFATTMGAGIFLTQHKSVMSEAFAVSTDYMPSNDSAVDLYVNSIQWSRRFVGLRLFLSLCAAGWQGYAQHVEHSISMIDRLADAMIAKGWALRNQSRMAVACLVPPKCSVSIQELVKRVVSAGSSWVSVTRFEGQEVIRVCATNGNLSEADVDQLVTDLIQNSI